MRVTQEQKQYIKDNLEYRPRVELARKIGISYNALLRWVHFYGGSINKESSKANIELRDKIREMYKSYSASEIAASLNMKKTSVIGYIERMRLHREEGETKERLRKKSNMNMRYTITEENLRKRSAVARKLIKRDLRRILSGEEPLTRRYYRMYPQKTHSALAYLCRKYNYFMAEKKDRKEPVAFYDSETRRLPPRKEKYYKEKYHITFRQAED